MTVCGQRWKTAIANAMSASRRFPTAAHSPWKTLCVSHIPTAPTIVLVSLPKPKNERTQPPGLATSVQAHPSMRICCEREKKYPVGITDVEAAGGLTDREVVRGNSQCFCSDAALVPAMAWRF